MGESAELMLKTDRPRKRATRQHYDATRREANSSMQSSMTQKDDRAVNAEVEAAGRTIGVVLFEGFSFLMMSVISDLFRFANEAHAARSNGATFYDVRFLSLDGGQIRSSSSLDVWTHACEMHRATRFDVLFIGDGEGARLAAAQPRLLRWLAATLPGCPMVEAFAEGREVLDAARARGWRDGGCGQATVRAAADASDWATPTTTALARVKRDLGVLVAHEVASRLSSAGASALNSVFVKGSAASSTQRVRAAVQWFEANCTHAVQVSDVARMAAMSERNFLRCFKVETGLTPLKFLLRARLELTSTLLVSTDLSLDGIARRCGWRGGETMARVFVKRFACTPAEYRLRARSRMPKATECIPVVQGAN